MTSMKQGTLFAQKKKQSIVLCLMLCCIVSLRMQAESKLRSPWDGHPVQLTDATYTCPPIVHLSPDLTTSGFYSDSKSSVIDPEKWKAYTESSGSYKELGSRITNAADAYRTTGSRESGA